MRTKHVKSDINAPHNYNPPLYVQRYTQRPIIIIWIISKSLYMHGSPEYIINVLAQYLIDIYLHADHTYSIAEAIAILAVKPQCDTCRHVF